MEPEIQIKNLKVAEFASEETLCFQATVYVDGKPFCEASNEGRGGENNFRKIPRGPQLLEDAIRKVGLRIRPDAFETHAEARKANEASGLTPGKNWNEWEKAYEEGRVAVTDREAFDHAVDRAVNDALLLRDLKRALKNRILFTKDGEGGLFQTKRLSAEQINMALDDPKFQERLGARVVLNKLDIEEALALYREHGRR